MKNIKSFHLFENSGYLKDLNKDKDLVDWLMNARFDDDEDFYENEPLNIITPYGEKINADFGSADDDYTGDGDWSFASSYVDDYGILYQVFGYGRGYDYDTAYEGLEWDNEISNVEFSDVFNAPKLIVRIYKEYPLIASKIYSLCDDPTKELIRIKLELAGMANKETSSLFKGGSLLNRFGDI